ncbi:hypothetical protein BE04_35670 [Sorangium cellulosum]|uniref:eCIS core domain-containing protein n=1 Tax=Sorangium cellulosum TaxID=56 RepID=A0A150Q705_SORCE|nr:hypothetical protein BE04_35670 [Sorangium cellulosum]
MPPPLAEPKSNAASRAQVRAQGARAEVADGEYDHRMRRALAERATQPVRAKAAVYSGYGDLVAAARVAQPPRAEATSTPQAWAPGIMERRANAPVQPRERDDLGASPDNAPGATTPLSALPFRAEMEAIFGASFAGVAVERGRRGPGGAEAAAEPERITFADVEPSRATVAHELAHVVQHRRSAPARRGVVGSRDDPAEREARRAASAALAGIPVRIERAPTAHTHLNDGPATAEGQASTTPDERARAIHEALHGSWFTTDADGAVRPLRGLSPRSVRAVRQAYLQLYDASLEEELEGIPQGRALVLPALTIVERLALQLGTFDDNEDGIMQILRTATAAELREAASDLRIYQYLDELDADQDYEARKMLWPDRRLEHAVRRLQQAEGTINDDESAVYQTLLDLSPAERRQLWYRHQSALRFIDDGDERATVRRMCIDAEGNAASEAAALEAAMGAATLGAGTDDALVALCVGEVAELSQERARIAQALDTGVASDGTPLSDAERRALTARQGEIAGVPGLVAADSTFMEDLHGDVSAEEFSEFGAAMGMDVYARAKQRLLDALGTFNDDEDAIFDTLRDLQAPVTPPDGRPLSALSADEQRRLQREANAELRRRLRDDPDLAGVWGALDDDERAMADDYVGGDSYRVALRELERAYDRFDTDELAILRIAARMSAEDRERLTRETPPIYYNILLRPGLNEGETALFQEVLRTGRLPLEATFDVAMTGDGTDEDLVNEALRSISDAERQTYRFGYWIEREGIEPDTDAGRAALQTYRDMRARLDSELEDEELDAALTHLLGTPTPEEVRTAQGRAIAADIMYHRQRERLELMGGWLDWAITGDETATQAHEIFEGRYRAAQSGSMSMEQFLVLVGLNQEFDQSLQGYQQTVETVGNIAGTIAATVIGIVLVIASEGTLAPAAAKLISAWGGAALWGAVGGGTAMVATREAIAGDFYTTFGAEGARDFTIGAVEGATTIAASRLATAAVEMVGLSGQTLTAAVTRAALGATDAGLATVGRAAAGASLEAAIDGLLSGAAGELTMTATDAQTWRQTVWNVLGSMGMALLRGGAMGAGVGAVTGGLLGGGGAYRRYRGLQGIPTTWSDDLGGAVAGVDTVGGVSLRLSHGIDDASLLAHADEALRLHSYSELRERILGALTGRRVFPPGSRAFEAQEELRKLLPIMDDRAAALASGTLDPDTQHILRSQLDVMEARAEHFRGVVDAGDLSPGTGSIGQPQAPPGPPYYPDPPAGHYYARTDQGWDLRRYPGARDEGVEPMTLVPDGPDRFRVVRRPTDEPVELFAEGTTDVQAFELLAGADSRSSFRAYFEMLQNAEPPIASRAEIIAAIGEPGGRTVDSVRHALKKRYREEVLRRMTRGPDGSSLDQAASWQRMRDMTLPLNSSDRGNITEDWYAFWNTPDAQRQVTMANVDFPDMAQDRRADIVHEGVMREVKSGDGALSTHDREQFEDFMRAVRPGGGATIGGEQVSDVIYVFTSPRAAKLNGPWIHEKLRRYRHLSVELYDWQGGIHRFDHTNLANLDPFLASL